MSYATRYYHFLYGDLRDLDLLSAGVRNNIIKALTVLAKYLRVIDAWNSRLKEYDIKLTRPSVVSTFARMLRTSKSDILQWLRQVSKVVRPNESLYLRFCLLTGLRKAEAESAFNMIIRLSREGKLSEYYSEELQCLNHFKYSQYLRKTKNVYISYVHKDLIDQIVRSDPVSYQALRRRLQRKHYRTRIQDLRSFFATWLVHHNVVREEADLVEGRIPGNVFVQFYFTPQFKDLSTRVLNAVRQLEAEIA